MINKKQLSLYDLFIRGAAMGLAAGIGLGLLLKAMEAATGMLVYTLLLNVDFIAFLPAEMPEALEFALHLAVSVPLGILYLWLVQRLGIRLWPGLALGLLTACLWVPLTLASNKVPAIDEGLALLLWTGAHLVYGCLLALFAGKRY
ncbi:hypothetical protein [Paenibacillus nasutitermitis]|uniref:Uncharacterized protein n=1 Tax=Paenibacillus nasutitermitis TaxID=1652958 RepID=A0A917DNH3_9BACL|nr:hypothetical protein [Paenibacillus nasutitermitis]GGD55897.1 hypothetical protein GCM10010911_12000 [Paenibacillus nasutitermitis]